MMIMMSSSFGACSTLEDIFVSNVDPATSISDISVRSQAESYCGEDFASNALSKSFVLAVLANLEISYVLAFGPLAYDVWNSFDRQLGDSRK